MATTTHRIAVNADAYVNVSNGNLNCTVVNGNHHLRLLVGSGDPAPDADTPDFVAVNSSGVASVENLEAEDDIWIRTENGEGEVVVIRGPARIVSVS